MPCRANLGSCDVACSEEPQAVVGPDRLAPGASGRMAPRTAVELLPAVTCTKYSFGRSMAHGPAGSCKAVHSRAPSGRGRAAFVRGLVTRVEGCPLRLPASSGVGVSPAGGLACQAE